MHECVPFLSVKTKVKTINGYWKYKKGGKKTGCVKWTFPLYICSLRERSQELLNMSKHN